MNSLVNYLVIALAFAGGIYAGTHYGRWQIQKEAVKRSLGVWTFDPESGLKSFSWKETP